MKVQLFLSTVALSLIASTVAQDAQKSIVDNAVANSDLKTLASIVGSPAFSAIKTALSGAGPFTVFAPNDAAFTAANIDTSNTALVENVLKYHVISGKIQSADLQAIQFPTTLLTDASLVNLPDGKGQVVGVTKGDKGVTVAYGLKSANVVKADLESSNGVIHIIDQVLLPPVKPSQTASNANLTALVDALTKANLVETVDGLKGATIFAPVDEAFKKANAGSLNATALTNVLKYHVVSPGVKYSTDLKDGDKLTTVQGNVLNVKIANGSVTINGAKVVTANVLTSNGVVHVLDGVLIPGQQSNSSTTTGGSNPTTTPKSGASSNIGGVYLGGIVFGLVTILLT
ncbi:Fasciclin-domain-containing protein [Basidiobolus meristosporus CBS 931.73]|uniref:Fasciclin-domain-containing protein n=1 Tax=Basidiobolus meristosporus CBS 931.73 TaxID=1314790 RepID=A0A1Y1YXY2_9FUNG|nr:Fasciclin-domain-containing protein [Basidiobolus meristosporus CBS 931.73]|eukprot:ORY02898.1 Fasciclin-domain-containing protein [Basidiobolus meristosporus CBS 931.73]